MNAVERIDDGIDICLYCTNVGGEHKFVQSEDDMRRISIDVNEEDYMKLNSLATLHGKSITDFVLERALGSAESENIALKELEELLDSRIRAAKAGAVSRRSASEVFAKVAHKKAR